MKLNPLIFVSLLAGISIARAQSTITFQPAALPGGGKIIYSWAEQDLLFTPSASLASNDIFNNGYPYNGSAYIQNIGFPQLLTIVADNSRAFSLFGVDLAEYSTAFPTPVGVTFVGQRFDGSTVDITFTTDGIIDGNGPLTDFQTFYFPSSFTGIKQIMVQSASFLPYSMDNLRVEIMPEPTVVGLISCAFFFWLIVCTKRSPNHLLSAAANRRPAGPTDGSDNLSATLAADRAFPSAVADRWADYTSW